VRTSRAAVLEVHRWMGHSIRVGTCGTVVKSESNWRSVRRTDLGEWLEQHSARMGSYPLVSSDWTVALSSDWTGSCHVHIFGFFFNRLPLYELRADRFGPTGTRKYCSRMYMSISLRDNHYSWYSCNFELSCLLMHIVIVKSNNKQKHAVRSKHDIMRIFPTRL
jgi:hypothetical protein